MTKLRELEENNKRLKNQIETERSLSDIYIAKLDKLYYIMKADKRTISRLERKLKFVIKELYNERNSI